MIRNSHGRKDIIFGTIGAVLTFGNSIATSLPQETTVPKRSTVAHLEFRADVAAGYLCWIQKFSQHENIQNFPAGTTLPCTAI